VEVQHLINAQAQLLGRRGGRARAAKLSAEKRREIARKGGLEKARRKRLGLASPLQLKKKTAIRAATRKLISAVLSSTIEVLADWRDRVEAIDNPRKKRAIHKRKRGGVEIDFALDTIERST
jgi:hypothetical protein